MPKARAISERTRVALQAARVRGVRLGATNPACRNLSSESLQRGANRTASLAEEAYLNLSFGSLSEIQGLKPECCCTEPC